MKSVVRSFTPSRWSLVFLVSVAVVLAACANPSGKVDNKKKQVQLDQALALFSANPAEGLPQGWQPLLLMRKKRATEYRLVKQDDRTVLHASAHQASSGLRHEVSIDPMRQPWLNWSWKTAALIKSADNHQRDTEDSPVRIALAFDGDRRKLSFMDTILFDTAKLISGQEFPYATLMYIWENKAPKETIIANTRTSRIQMLVAESGPENVGNWVSYRRNIVDDYVKAFGEQPGRLIAVGVLTDTDNTGEQVEAWYGDIRLSKRALPALR